MRHFVALPVVAALSALGLSGCTSQDEATVLAGVETACTVAGVGSQIAVTVISKGQAQTIAQTVGAGVSTSCGLLVPAVQSIVSNITAAGGTAQVTVTTTPASGGPARSMRFRARRAADGTVTYVFPPVSSVPFLGGLGL